uniref:Gypsy retrotransposon integrase-like protein 1 n=1 Tax=Leptobrachium leishanense TaxID=445787 RepID=A0A8C5WHT0_9ANUR
MTGYGAYKRDVLRGMLENRGGAPGSKSREAMMEELRRMDQEAAFAALPVDIAPGPVPTEPEDSDFHWRVRQRVAMMGPAPTEAAMQNLIREVSQMEEREKDRAHELRLAEVQSRRSSRYPSDRSTGRKVPFQAFKEFREAEEEIESYLQDFERLCQVHEVHRADWVRILACKLTGRAAEAYRTVPQGPRQELLRLAHDIPLSGHLGQTKTRHRLARAFFWPRLSEDTRDYCRTCPVCQKTGKAGDHPKAPLRPMPIIQEPFSRVAVDIIGPLPRPSATGKRYILTVVDYATRYPEAVALANIQADTVADALLRVFTRVGFPREILSDQGTQFTAELTQQLWRLCGVRALHSAPYHPQTNGLCERFNGTLKQLIRAFVHESRDWEKYLPHLLFAYREVPQESTGYSPFELLYGRQVRGPLDLVRAQWEGVQEEDGVPVLDYVLKLRERLAELAGFVQENMETAQAQQKAWYDRAACSRSFCVGQKVLVLKPQRQNKLQAAWQGPYKVVTQLGDTTYVVVSCADTRIQRTFHVNMLKAYHERPETVDAICAPAAEETEPFPLVELPGVAKQPSGVDQV